MYLELIIRRLITVCMAIAILGSTWAIPAQAQITLPVPGQMVGLSPSLNPAVLKGIKVFADKPFAFDFILDVGNRLKPFRTDESIKLIKYFLAGLTIPQGDLWVNLSPYEKDRIIPNEFGQTEMGRDLLAQDYILKQITAALMHPENPTGKQFWAKIYAQAQAKFGTTQIPVNTFNKVWIVPEQAEVYEGPTTNGQATAYVTKAKLKVMLEEDYLSMSHNVGAIRESPNQINSKIIQEIIIPVLEQEINQGQNFAQLRQIYYSLILATWYKKFAKGESASGGKAGIIAKQYVDQKKTNKETSLKSIDHIYQQYLKSFKKGVYNFIKEEPDPITGQNIPRKYFSGGARMVFDLAVTVIQPHQPEHAQIIRTDFKSNFAMPANQAMTQGKIINNSVDFWTGHLNAIFDKDYEDLGDRLADFERVFGYMLLPQDNARNEVYQKDSYVNNEVTDPEIFTEIGRWFRKRWHEKGLDGYANQYLGRLGRQYIKPKDFHGVFIKLGNLVKISSDENILEDFVARWQSVFTVLHLRFFGPHVDKVGEAHEFLDNDYIAKGVHDYLTQLIRWKDAPELNQFPPRQDGYKEEIKFTYKDLMLWGLVVMLDPLIHDYMWEPTSNRSIPVPDETRMTGLLRWPNGPGQAMEDYLKQMLIGDAVDDGVRKKQVEELLQQAFRITKEGWERKGLRTPWDVFSYRDNFFGQHPDVFGPDILPSATESFLKDRMFIIVASRDHHSSPLVQKAYFRDSSGYKYAAGLPSYMILTELPWMKEQFPNLVKTIELLDEDGKAKIALKEIEEKSKQAEREFKSNHEIFNVMDRHGGQIPFSMVSSTEMDVVISRLEKEPEWALIEEGFHKNYNPRTKNFDFPALWQWLTSKVSLERAEQLMNRWLAAYDAIISFYDDGQYFILIPSGRIQVPLTGAPFLVRKSNSAMASTAKSSTGGIDLNPLEKQLQTSGKNDFRFTDKAMANVRIDSLTPTLIGMEPLKSLPEFLGIN